MIAQVFLLISRPSKQGFGALLLPVTAFASVTALLTIVLGGAHVFWRQHDEMSGFYQMLSVIALVLMGVPLVSLGAAAARLSARRRDDRLAALRLLGATGSTTAAIAVLEAALLALTGAVVGVVTALAVSPLVGMIHFQGRALGTSAILPWWAMLAVIAAVTLIATLSAVASLKRVLISPLGVALKQQAPRIAWVPALIAVGALIVAGVIANSLTSFGSIAALIAAFGVAIVIALFALDAIGGWLVGVLARSRAKRATGAEQLLSARAILESPRASWRQVSGAAIASFVAVFAGSGVAMLGALDAGESNDLAPYLTADIRTGIIITVIGTFIMVACSVGVNQSAQILDRRDITRSLAIIGAPFELQDRARRQGTMLPLLLASLGSAGMSAVLLFPVVGGAMLLAPVTLAIMLGFLGLGIAIVAATLLATRPLFRRVAGARPEPTRPAPGVPAGG